MDPYTIRNASGSDLSFVYDAFLKSYRHDSFLGKTMKTSVFMREYPKVIDHILANPNSEVLIACEKEREATILGFGIFEPKIIHYLFVKEPFRRLGIAKNLIQLSSVGDGGAIQVSHLTLSIRRFLKNKPEFVHVPTLLYKKGVTHYG